MILLDTNALSALMQSTPDPVVVKWLDNQPVESVWTTSITVFEIRTGIDLLEYGRASQQLDQLFSQLMAQDLNGRVQSFDQTAALVAGTIAASRRRAGRVLDIRDVQIAGIAALRHATVSTRNTRHFAETGVELVNPWN